MQVFNILCLILASDLLWSAFWVRYLVIAGGILLFIRCLGFGAWGLGLGFGGLGVWGLGLKI